MKQTKEKIAEFLFFVSAVICILCVVLICLFLFAGGVPAMFKIGVGDFIFGMNWRPMSGQFGIFPMIVASICVTVLALTFVAPVGILTAVFLCKFCDKKIESILNPMISLLAAIPSVVYGFFGLVVVCPIIQEVFGVSGKSLLAASIILAIMILPTIIAVSQAAIKAVPEIYYEGALALGANKEESVFFAMLPAAKSGIIASIVLGMGRCVGETMAVIMVAGNRAKLPGGILDGVRTLTANIVLEMGYAADLHRDALISTAVVLFVFILVINLLFSIIKGKI
ncbi:MAG: phosphate ABC transporter permease subunit PstC [Chitinispirillales bacterium]|jgi:phosphate transport system permease protein|nr:phosphate ABC transporter permease subunit PstC [Chitinispirillales bacterium]